MAKEQCCCTQINTLKIATAAGIATGFCYIITTLGGLFSIPGYKEFSVFMLSMYGPYGYSISWVGVVIGGLYGFIEGFWFTGLIFWLYSKMINN